MAFHYAKNRESQGNDSFWTSYSDLFLGLSTIFLLLYVTSSLRTSTDAIKNGVENTKLRMKVEELEHQIKAYESIKDEYLNKQADKDEVQEYQDLMDKLTLLQEDAKTEKEKLIEQAQVNDKKAKALNKYQQMVRNIMNANKVAKTRITTRDNIIGDQDNQIGEQSAEITDLQKDITTKKQLIAESNEKIAATEDALKKKVTDLKRAFNQNKITRKAYEKQLATTKAQNEKALEALRGRTAQYSQQIAQANQKMNELNGQLASTQSALSQKESELSQKEAALAQTQAEAAGLQGKMNALKSGFAAQQAKERAAFEGELRKHKMSAAEQGRREAAFKAAAAKKEKELQGQLAGMQGKLSGLQGQLKDTEGALSKAKEEMDARRSIAKDIKEGFNKVGVKADIDMKTGEVVLDFGDSYFENDSANLNPKMRDILEKAMPVYSDSLFGNPKVAGKITTVEIIGFASPTYRGRFVDPSSNKPEDRAAIKYNMDLSYRRANAIFQHVLDSNGPDKGHQKDLLSLMKVSGRSFLEVLKVQNRNVAEAAEFCKQNDCRKAQRVIVRFSMDGKK